MIPLKNVIKDYKQIVDDKVAEAEAATKKLGHLIELVKIKDKRLSGKQLTENDTQQAMNLLCYGDFAACCHPRKECPWNQAVSDALGIDYKNLYEKKKETVREYLTSHP